MYGLLEVPRSVIQVQQALGGAGSGRPAGDVYINFYLALYWSLVKADICPVSAKGCWPPVPVVPIPRALSLFSSLSPASLLRPRCKEGPGMSCSYGPIYRGKNPMSLNDLRGHCIGPILKPVRICEEVILKHRSLKTFALIL